MNEKPDDGKPRLASDRRIASHGTPQNEREPEIAPELYLSQEPAEDCQEGWGADPLADWLEDEFADLDLENVDCWEDAEPDAFMEYLLSRAVELDRRAAEEENDS